MSPFRAVMCAVAATALIAPLLAEPGAAQTSTFTEKMNAYVGCINRLS